MPVLSPDFKEFQSRIELQNQTTDSLMRGNPVKYNGVPVTLSPDYISSKPKRELEGQIGLLLLQLDLFKPLLPIFPNIQARFENRTIDVEMFGTRKRVIPSFLYEPGNKTLYITSKGIPTEGYFGHEFGHHMHSFFSEQQQRKILDRQKWIVMDKEERVATFEDLLKQMNSDIPEGLEAEPTHWLLKNGRGETGRGYRHSNPCEMIAETVAENLDDIFTFVSEQGLYDEKGQGPVIDYLLGKLQKI